MKIVTRYIIKETIGPFLVGVFFFSFLLVLEVLFRIIKMIIEKNVPLHMAAEFFLYMLPFNLAISIPMAVLMGSIMAYGRLSGDNETVALRAGGLSPRMIYFPIFMFGVFMFVFMLFFNDVVLSEGNYRYKAMYLYILNIKPSIAVEPYSFRTLPNTKKRIGVKHVKDDVMYDVIIYDGELSKDTTAIITAEKGSWSNNTENSSLITLHLQNGFIQEMNKVSNAQGSYTPFTHFSINIKQDIRNQIGGHKRGLRELPSWELRKQIDERKKQGQPVPANYVIEYQKKASIPAACLLFVLLGAPLGTISRRSGKGIGFGMSAVIIAVYYGIMVPSENMGNSGMIPPVIAMWIPNIVLGVFALVVLLRTFLGGSK